jgi:arylsulfatase
MAGKWHLGDEEIHSPYAHGFEQTFAMMHGGGSHWADMRPLSPTQHMFYRKNGKRLEKLPHDFYSSRNYTDALIEFIESNKGDGKPFTSRIRLRTIRCTPPRRTSPNTVANTMTAGTHSR